MIGIKNLQHKIICNELKPLFKAKYCCKTCLSAKHYNPQPSERESDHNGNLTPDLITADDQTFDYRNTVNMAKEYLNKINHYKPAGFAK